MEQIATQSYQEDRRPALIALLGLSAVVLGAGLFFVAIAQADLRSTACNGYFRLDAADAYCRSAAYFAIPGIVCGVCGLVLLVVSCVLAWSRRGLAGR